MDCLYSIEFLDLSFIVPILTWSNMIDEDAFVAKKLDRVLGNITGFNQLNFVTVGSLISPGISHHCPSYISFGEKLNFGPIPFKFFRYWADHKNFLE